MVLVSDKPSNGIGILQTKLSDREGYDASRGGLEAVPLDQHIEGGHGERQPGLEILPDAVHHLLEMADERQHRQHRFNEDALLPLSPSTQFEVGGITLRRMERRITQHNHALVELPHEPLKRVIRRMGRITRPCHHQAILIHHQTEFATHNPAMIGEAFPAHPLRPAAFTQGMDPLDSIRVDDAEDGWGGQEGLRPVVMRREETQEPGPLGEVGKQRPRVARQPAIEGAVADAFECVTALR